MLKINVRPATRESAQTTLTAVDLDCGEASSSADVGDPPVKFTRDKTYIIDSKDTKERGDLHRSKVKTFKQIQSAEIRARTLVPCGQQTSTAAATTSLCRFARAFGWTPAQMRLVELDELRRVSRRQLYTQPGHYLLRELLRAHARVLDHSALFAVILSGG